MVNGLHPLEMNHYKWDLTHEECVQLCREVVAARFPERRERSYSVAR